MNRCFADKCKFNKNFTWKFGTAAQPASVYTTNRKMQLIAGIVIPFVKNSGQLAKAGYIKDLETKITKRKEWIERRTSAC